MTMTGGCACEAIIYTATGEPKFAFFCQCRDCQLMTGSGHATYFCHSAEDFAVKGETSSWSRITEAGETVTKHFCPTCGSPIYGTTTRADSIVMVLAGSLDDPAGITPDRIFFEHEAQPWDCQTIPASA